jgi:hypothetical protein
MVEGCKLHPLRQMMLPPWRTDDGMIDLGTSGLQKGELLKVCSVLALRHLMGPMLCSKFILKEGDLLSMGFGVFTGGG